MRSLTMSPFWVPPTVSHPPYEKLLREKARPQSQFSARPSQVALPLHPSAPPRGWLCRKR